MRLIFSTYSVMCAHNHGDASGPAPYRSLTQSPHTTSDRRMYGVLAAHSGVVVRLREVETSADGMLALPTARSAAAVPASSLEYRERHSAS